MPPDIDPELMPPDIEPELMLPEFIEPDVPVAVPPEAVVPNCLLFQLRRVRCCCCRRSHSCLEAWQFQAWSYLERGHRT